MGLGDPLWDLGDGWLQVVDLSVLGTFQQPIAGHINEKDPWRTPLQNHSEMRQICWSILLEKGAGSCTKIRTLRKLTHQSVA
mmetsp:Transcript_12114/g.28026  ORF Transcript_12114/g.28026 Transcript_12114/m.28026 type:complete len:82 (+) Transcript_12114:967-1212(+)